MQKLTQSLLTYLTYCLLGIGLLFAQNISAEEFLEVSQAFPVEINAQEKQIDVHVDIAKGYALYKQSLEFKLSSSNRNEVQTIEFPPADKKFDANFQEVREVYHYATDIALLTSKEISPDETLSITFQGCAEGGICYPPETVHFNLDTQTIYTPESNPITNDTTPIAQDFSMAQTIANAPLWYMIAICFGFGVLLSLTPCVLPMLPILLRVLVGDTNTPEHKTPHSKWHTIKLTLLYILGMSIIYTALGIISASLGASLALWLQKPLVLIGFGVLLIIFSLSLFDLFQMQTPLWIQNKLNQLSQHLPAGQSAQSFIMGMMSGLICGPCIAAPLAGVLLFIAQSGDTTIGAIALFSLAWGQGFTLLLLGIGASQFIPKAGQWMQWIKGLCGALLIMTAIWIMYPGIKSFMPNATHQAETTQYTHIQSISELNHILDNNTSGVFIKVRADWCTSCDELDQYTLSDPQVINLLKPYQHVMIDVTNNTPEKKALLKQLNIFGPPALLFFKPHETQANTRLIGFVSAKELIQILE
ncbi:MAG: protein-disulfide reductase DsbD [Alcaligenaceae bacterium]|nr:protein-disulfide reductase DsbD [Alcaligenaceae bacterium]